MYIEEVIDSLYGPTPRLTIEDLQFMVDMNEAKKNLDKGFWYHNKAIYELTLDELLIVNAILIDNNKLFFRDEWRKLIQKEIFNKLKTSTYEVIEKNNDSDNLF